jgi:hypothetical protein
MFFMTPPHLHYKRVARRQAIAGKGIAVTKVLRRLRGGEPFWAMSFGLRVDTMCAASRDF